MPAYKLSASESGGFRSLLPPDPKPPSRIGRILGYVLTFVIGVAGGVLICAPAEDRTMRPQYDNGLAVPADK